ncbi:hypothetical protein SOCE26_018100 [Sorangium cellulosum]|uniref:Glycosyl hydrolases family 38 C-terminal beta sandwich domain-containing protein n=1 Tax=Sorangium cellulosum TaxID=56 RepID=A0A2L0EM90_SORCE|nr:hypothetical protein [Sorangium cellulosum]AUX40409.1 hypothetical protein SOCE26_018100 [Sorangium cellulosum]
MRLPDGRTVLHVINHEYSGGVVEQVIRASFPVEASPTEVTVASLDFEADRPAPFTYEDGVVTVEVGELPASAAIVVE